MMVIHGMMVEDDEVMRLALLAARDGLRRAESDPAMAEQIEQEMGLYYRVRDGVRITLDFAYRMAASEVEEYVSQRSVDGGETLHDV